jgi:hypothetical protein
MAWARLHLLWSKTAECQLKKVIYGLSLHSSLFYPATLGTLSLGYCSCTQFCGFFHVCTTELAVWMIFLSRHFCQESLRCFMLHKIFILFYMLTVQNVELWCNFDATQLTKHGGQKVLINWVNRYGRCINNRKIPFLTLFANVSRLLFLSDFFACHVPPN